MSQSRVVKKEVPAVPFHANAISRFNEENKIFLTPNQYFNAKFSRIFTRTKIQHSLGAEMAFGANMSYWPQQLNFAVWCATTGCGISREALDKVPEQIKSFLMFHICIKVRRILFEMGGIQSESALPGDPTFSRIHNNYDTPSFKLICRIWNMQNLEFHQVRTSASKKVIITVSDLFPFMCHMLVRKQIIQQLILEEKNSAMKVEKLLKEFFCFHGHYFHRYSVTFYSIIFLCLCHS